MKTAQSTAICHSVNLLSFKKSQRISTYRHKRLNCFPISSVTAAANEEIYDRFAIRYLPRCSNTAKPEGRVISVDLFREAPLNGKIFALKNGGKAHFTVVTSSDASADLRISDGKRFCDAAVPLELGPGARDFSLKLPRNFQGRNKIQVQVDGIMAVRKVKSKKKGRRKISKAKFNRQCSSIFRTLALE
ncbi:MAG: hypothetical protein R3A13_02540 [Bdellovibrionota bacterium]